jgi:hypothetical protein
MACRVTYVLSHNHDGSDGAKGLAHNANLLGGNVIDVNENALFVLGAAGLNGGPDFLLGFLFVASFLHC